MLGKIGAWNVLLDNVMSYVPIFDAEFVVNKPHYIWVLYRLHRNHFSMNAIHALVRADNFKAQIDTITANMKCRFLCTRCQRFYELVLGK